MVSAIGQCPIMDPIPPRPQMKMRMPAMRRQPMCCPYRYCMEVDNILVRIALTRPIATRACRCLTVRDSC